MLNLARNSNHDPVVTRERRSQKDRRQRHFSSLFWMHPERRRRHVRRRTDKRRLYLLDYYKPILFYWVVLVLLLSLADATLTLWLIDLGAEELNPIMDRFLKIGPFAFVIAKYLFTSISLVIIVLLNHLWIQRLRFSVHWLLYGFACLFGGVIIWQIFLLKAYAF